MLNRLFSTFAAIADYQVKDNEGEDSYNILPLLSNVEENTIIREATVHHSIQGEFTICKGKWKLLVSPSSGGWSYPRPEKDDDAITLLPPYQLYDMEKDPGETNNVYKKYPTVLDELKQLLVKYIEDGRSTPGIKQTNDGKEIWKQIEWIKTN